MSRLVAIWNKLPGAKPVSKFKDRSTALRRIWAAISALEPETRTKVELVIGLLSQPAGATLKEIMAATEWQANSVRGFIGTYREGLASKSNPSSVKESAHTAFR